MTAKIISGTEIAKQIREELKQEIAELKEKHNLVPGLVTVLVGADPAVVLAGLKRHISSRFLLSTSAIALALFLCTAAIFLLFPRMGLGFLFKGVSASPVSGFADRIELGHFGTVRQVPESAGVVRTCRHDVLAVRAYRH